MKNIGRRALPLLMLVVILFQINPVHALDVSASSAILMDAGTGNILYEKNSNTQREMASTSKIMTYLLTMEAISKGDIALTDKVKVSKNATRAGGSSYNLRENDVLTVSELLNSMMMISANDSAVVLAEHVSGSVSNFVVAMNNKAKSLGLKSAYFVNPNGMPLPCTDQNKISAKDLALLTRYTINKYEEHLINITSQKQFIGTYKSFSKRNTNGLLRSTTYTDGLKTGYTNKARHCLVSTAKVSGGSGNRVIAVVLGGASSSQRFEDSQKMLEYGISREDITVSIDGTQLICDVVKPFIKDGTTLVPLAKISNQLGANIVWEPNTKSVIGTNGASNFKLTIANNKAIINGKRVELAAAPVIVKGTTMVPIKFIAESLGMNVHWDSDIREVQIAQK